MNAFAPAGWLLVVAVAVAGCNAGTVEPPSGRDAYLRYCASCHGIEATGNGPVAKGLGISAPDLTTIVARAGGSFDEAEVLSWIDGRRLVAAHGPRDMPVWGVIFESELREGGKRYPGYASLLSSRTLVDYLRGIQTPSGD